MTVTTAREALPSLLLLPFPPDPSNLQALSAAYRPSLVAALSRLKSPDRQSKLIVAVACPILHGQFARFKSLSWSEVQSLLAGMYTIIAVVCSQLSVPTEADGGPGSVDVTVVLVDHDRERRFQPGFRPAIEGNNTVIVDLATFASAYHPWNFIFHVRSEIGLQIYQAFLGLFEGMQPLRQDQLVPVEGGISLKMAQLASLELPPQTATYSAVCLGGTFDHLHPGHKLLLAAGALLLGVPQKGSPKRCQFIVGITGDEMLKKKKYAEFVQPWAGRARASSIFSPSSLSFRPLAGETVMDAQYRRAAGKCVLRLGTGPYMSTVSKSRTRLGRQLRLRISKPS